MSRVLIPVALALVAAVPAPAAADAQVGQAAPAFTLTDSRGAEHSLADYRGRWVVLEWVNYECPFVGKHYGPGNMQRLQREYTGRGVAWLAINSSAAGKQGHYAPARIEAMAAEREAAHTAYLIDAPGSVGRLYGAKTTPHMFVIDPEGRLVYAGGIDDRPSTDVADIEGATNRVAAALEAGLAGQPIERSFSPPYGCAVKY